jgi:hypothetical protein
MYTRGRRLRFTAVSAMVVLALTGFSTGRGHGSRSHHSGGGGGCSSSRQNHDSSSSSGGGGSYGSGTSTGGSGGGTYRSRPTHRSTPTATASSTGSARPLKDGTVVLVHCASVEDPYATVEVRNPNGREGVFYMKMTFKDRHGFTLIDAGGEVSVPAKGKATSRVAVASSGVADKIDHCEVERRAPAVR